LLSWVSIKGGCGFGTGGGHICRGNHTSACP
jgi:hypothetical protein